MGRRHAVPPDSCRQNLHALRSRAREKSRRLRLAQIVRANQFGKQTLLLFQFHNHFRRRRQSFFRNLRCFVAHGKIQGENENPDRRQTRPRRRCRPENGRESSDEGRRPKLFLLSTLDFRRSTSSKNFRAPLAGDLPERLALQFLFKIVRFHFLFCRSRGNEAQIFLFQPETPHVVSYFISS